jgi:hypothetical protein
MKPTCLLQDWSLRVFPTSSYQAPELHTRRLVGKVYGHPRFEDGVLITTSSLINQIDEETYETNNTIYKVGKKDPNYQLYLNEYNSEV